MKKKDIQNFIVENGLLSTIPANSAGIYAITIDGRVVYIGESKNLAQRCAQHIYNVENAMLNQEKKYLLLLSAKLGGHKVDCELVETCNLENRFERENYWITTTKPILNKNIYCEKRQEIDNLRIEDILNGEYYHLSYGWVKPIAC